MPSVPRYNGPSVSPQGGTNPQRIEDQLGPAVQRLGVAVGQAGELISNHAIRQRQEDTEAEYKQGDAALLTGLNDLQNEYGELQGEAAVAAHPEYLNRAAALKRRIAAGLNPVAAKMFNQSSPYRMASYSDRVAGYASGQRREWVVKSSNARIAASAADAVANFNDQLSADRAGLVIRSEIESRADIPVEEKPVKAAELISNMTVGRIERALSASPDRGREMFEANKADLIGDDLIKAERAVTNAVENVDAIRDADAAVTTSAPDAYTFAGFQQRLAAKESSGGTNTVATTSSARGLFQYTEGTWAALVNSPAGKAAGLTIEGRNDNAQQTKALGISVRQYEGVLKRLGAPFNEKNLYMVHFMGEGGFSKFWKELQANPGANAPEAFPVAAKANQNVFYNRDGTPRTLSEVYNFQTRSFPARREATTSWEELQANPALVIERADQEAEARHPGDVAYREKVRAQALQTVSRHAASAANVHNSALALVTKNLQEGSFPSEAAAMADPQFASAWGKLNEDEQRGLRYFMQFQATLDPHGQQVVNAPPITETIDRHDQQVMAAYDTGFKMLQNTWRNLSPEQLAAVNLSYVKSAGVVPPSWKSSIVGDLYNSSPDAIVRSANTLAQLVESNPVLANSFSDQDVTRATMVQNLVRSGVTPVDAVQVANKNLAVPEDERTRRREEFNQIHLVAGEGRVPRGNIQPHAFDVALAETFYNMSGLEGDIDTPGFSAMRDGFERAAREQFVGSGDINAATSSARSAITRTWRLTEINGSPRYMPMAPEIYFGIYGASGQANDTAWMRRQLEADVGALLPPQRTNVDFVIADQPQFTNISLTPSPLPSRNGMPSYFVTITKPDGTQAQVRNKDGITPMLWQPDRDAEVRLLQTQGALSAMRGLHLGRSVRAERQRKAPNEYLGPMLPSEQAMFGEP